ncbi:MAG TPA: IS66 family transposase [Terriglobia bacterium]|nr:IS66 family transposase [Terriglobia bacterium]
MGLNYNHGMLISDELFDAYLKCKTKAQLTFRQAGTDEPSHAISDWQRRLAENYRADCCDRLQSAYNSQCLVGSPRPEDLKSAKYRLIIQPYMSAQGVGSNFHALERRPAETQKRHNPYAPIRFVPFEKISRIHKLTLAFDAFVVWKATGQMPTKGVIIHGLQHAALGVKLDAWIHEVDSLVGKLRALLAEGTPPDPVLIKHCAECIFEACCRKRVTEKDDLSLLVGLGTTDRAKLNAKGIFTVTQLAYTFRPRRRPKHQASRREKYHHALKALAIRDRKIHVAGKPELALDGTPVYLDVESLPDRSFYYLIGLRIPEGSSFLQYSLWADEPSDEERIWRSLLGILQGIDKPVLIHYGAYETTFLKRLAIRYPTSIADTAFVDALIKRAVNLLTITYSQIYFPTYSNGLKEVARHLGFQWSHPSASGLQSVIWRQQWEETTDPSIKQTIITYNKEDCEALELVTRAVERVAIFAERRNESGANANEVCIHAEDVQKGSKWRKFTSPIPALEAINEAAHWDYQRDRIYVRNSGRRRRPSPLRTQPRIVRPRVNKTVVCSVPSRCPVCRGKNINVGPQRSKIIYDLRFGKASVKRWIVKYFFRNGECLRCGEQIQLPERAWGRGKYGWNLIAFLLYEIVELSVPQRVATRQVNRLFGLTLPRSSVAEQKKMGARLYEESRQILLRRIIAGTLVHADETPIVTQGKRAFVWVFCNYEEVVYIYSENREAGTAQTILKDFKGVLVSDFYSAYDSIDCPQQKCLIHLMRDLNDDMLKNPYDDELRGIVQQFAELLKPIVDTVDRHGLKKHFLKKHLSDVKRFYKWLVTRQWQSEVAAKCTQRFEKNRNKLFTFLSYDGVPWNNNNAEHAMKAFAALRDVIEGTTTPSGIEEYLILLSVSETCRYKNVDFLEFLRSREKDINAFLRRG